MSLLIRQGKNVILDNEEQEENEIIVSDKKYSCFEIV